MKLYYIDESMFQNSHFASQVLHRFEQLLAKNQDNFVLISVTKEHNKHIEHFLSSQKHTTVLQSPALFDFASVRGNLHTTFLAVDEFPVMESFSGSCVEYDTDAKQAQRIYLELFIDHDEIDMEYIVKEMEEMLHEKIEFLKKKTIMN